MNYGVIIAESVAPRFTKGLGMVMEDPCFEAKYLEKYQNGRVRAINNIYEVNLTPCHIEQLERLEIKANLVAPIINEGTLLGLLVANQCSQFRDWQSYEIRWFSQIAMQVGFALENAKLIEANRKANELNKSIFLPQQEDLKQVVIDLSGDSQMIFKAFYNKSLNLLNYLAACRKQIQEILDSAKVIKMTAEQIEKQVQRNSNLLEEERESIKTTLESIPVFEEAVTDNEMIVKQLNKYCQNLSNLITQQTGNSGEIEKIYEIVEIMQARNQQILTWAESLQTNKQKLDHIVTANIQLSRLVGNIIQTATNQTQNSKELEQNMVLAHKIAQNISEKSQFLTNLFAQLSAFARNSTDKIMFWERLKSFMASFNRLITSIIKKN